jgi:Holin of 3TMs, for gene-transfer release
MGAFALIPVIGKVLDRVLPDKAANDAAKAQLAQMIAAGEIQEVSDETKGATQIITAEAQSQSWIARNVRPLLLFCWGSLITFNFTVPVIARFWIPGFQPIVLDPWVFKLTAIGFTGYVTARTWEKVTGSDN